MPRSHKEVEILIVKLEQSLREAKLWSSTVPSIKALQSQLPFAIDTMSFEQWLQFVFIPKMSELVSTDSTLPDNVELLPMAQQRFGAADYLSGVTAVLSEIDLLFGGS
jgi:uncharacterized protein YqcC (DUF446 family)